MSQLVGPVGERLRRASPLTDAAWQARLRQIAADPAMADDNVTMPGRSAGRLAGALLAVGAAGILLTLLGAFVVSGRHALAAYWVGVFAVLAISLGSLFFTMVFHSVNAGWSAAIRRQLENLAGGVWVAWLMILPILVVELLNGGVLLTWLDAELRDNFLIIHKRPYLNAAFFALRLLLYGAVWSLLAWRLRSWSLEQDRTGDRWLSSRMRYTSGWGLLAFALTVAFAAFDWLMSMDFRFYSTMWGVFYFAISALSALSAVVVVLAALRTVGRLTNVVSAEHFHDLGKLMLAFTVFWAYISFSQYFLIWYGNIPEETVYYIFRKSDGWGALGVVLCVAHFIVPFFVLLFRGVKRRPLLLGAVAVYMLVMSVIDLVWIVRPMVYLPLRGVGEPVPGPERWWIDVAGVVGVFGIYGFFLVRRIASAPLVPLKDPLLPESLQHRNYV